MQGQQFRGPVRSVAQVNGDGAQIHYHGEPSSLPPVDPEMARECPQCRHLTWRYTKACMHCSLDLESWDRRTTGWRGWLRRLFSGDQQERHTLDLESIQRQQQAVAALLASVGMNHKGADPTGAPGNQSKWIDGEGANSELR